MLKRRVVREPQPVQRVILSVHVERAHLDSVRRQLDALATAVEHRGGRLTLFVCPGGQRQEAIVACRGVTDLMHRGHEIGQHTHYHRLGAPKWAPPTPEDVVRCLERDYGHLGAAGMTPRGFVGGGWSIHEEASAWLYDRGYVYDATFRNFALSYANPAAEAGEGYDAVVRRGGLLALPTSGGIKHGLVGHVCGRSRSIALGDARYEMWYLHDYDLLAARNRLAVYSLLALLARQGRLSTASDVARMATTAL